MAATTLAAVSDQASALAALRTRWPLYAIEAALLGAFMVSACAFAVLLEHPGSPVHRAVPGALPRRGLMGLAMGLTAAALIYSPWGRRSGAQMNPAVTLGALRTGRLGRWDALFYMAAQFLGGVMGVAVAGLALGAARLGHPAVNYVATVPGGGGGGAGGAVAAWGGEFVIAFVLMTVVLAANRHPRLIRYTGLLAGLLVAVYIIVEAPLSGMSMNPARTLGSAVSARLWAGLWIYFTAPVLGMLAAVEVRRRLGRRRRAPAPCAKFTHSHDGRCAMRCDCLRRLGIQPRVRAPELRRGRVES